MHDSSVHGELFRSLADKIFFFDTFHTLLMLFVIMFILRVKRVSDSGLQQAWGWSKLLHAPMHDCGLQQAWCFD